jgi:hypothetical protein
MGAGGSVAIKWSHSRRALPFASITCPRSCMPTTCNTRVAMSMPHRLIGCATERASAGYLVADDIATMLAHRSCTGKRRVHFMKTAY